MEIRNTLLLVNDNRDSRARLQTAFEKTYNVLEAENGTQALMLMADNHGCIAAVILDTHMAVKDGYQVMDEMAENDLLSEFPVIIVSDDNIAHQEADLFDKGASDVIWAPYDIQVVRRRVQNIVDLNRKRWQVEALLEKQAKHPPHAHEELVDTLSSILECRNPEPGLHVPRIRRYTQILLEEVARSCPEYELTPTIIDLISSAATFHDIGKILIPDAILTKPSRLTPEEWSIMQTHAPLGRRIFESLNLAGSADYLQYARNICQYHHERWDGTGYPEGLKGDDIPLCAQIVGLADVYDALTTEQVYKPAYPHSTAMSMILNGDCGCFSPKLLECLKAVSDLFIDVTVSYEDAAPSAEMLDFTRLSDPVSTGSSNTLQNTQLKYQALLCFLDATVMELDLDNQYYHVVYNTNPHLASLGDANTSSDLTALIRQVFVSEDAEELSRKLQAELSTFFSNKLRIQSFSHELRHVSTHWKTGYKFTLLRTEPEGSTHQRLIIICQSDASAPATALRTPDFISDYEVQQLLSGVFRCRNDLCLTLADSCASLANLLGYSEAELQDQFQNRLMNLVIPEDRQPLRQNMREQLSRSRSIQLEFRLLRKDGQPVWVLSKGYLIQSPEGEFLSCIMVDITQTKRELDRLRLSLERYQIITAQTDDIIFEWDLFTDTVTCTNKWQELFGYTPVAENISTQLATSSHFHPDDVQSFLERMHALKHGADYQETELRIAKSDGRYLWCRFRATAQYGADGTLRKVVGVIINIDAEKRATQALQNKAEQDALTKLLNKNASRQQVEHHLINRPPDHPAALLLLDLDNFKKVNDHYGHMFGDTVLTHTASVIRKYFRSEDVIARIGGDEFMVYMSNTPSLDSLKQRCSGLVNTFQNLFREQLSDCALSCSIGIALVPQHGTNFQELFQRADMALYRAKANGKNGYAFYDTTDHKFLPFSSPVSSRTTIDSDAHETASHQSLLQYTFRHLYESNDLEKTIPSILAWIGEQMNVSRVYIFENSPDNKTCSNTFEWCNKGILPNRTSLQDISYETDLPEYEENFTTNGIFYAPDVSALSPQQYNVFASFGTKSTLQCAIRDNGRFRGFVGFDECTSTRVWSQDQISLLTALSELLSVFLMKKRAQDSLAQCTE